MKSNPALLIVIFILCSNLTVMSQESILLLDKPGTFKTQYFSTFEPDQCIFTKSETTANYQKLLSLTDVLRRNPVLKEIKGFNCVLSKTREHCIPKEDYGIACQITIDFCSLSLDNGKEICWTSEPPEWFMNINRLRTFGASGSGVTAGSYRLCASILDTGIRTCPVRRSSSSLFIVLLMYKQSGMRKKNG